MPLEVALIIKLRFLRKRLKQQHLVIDGEWWADKTLKRDDEESRTSPFSSLLVLI